MYKRCKTLLLLLTSECLLSMGVASNNFVLTKWELKRNVTASGKTAHFYWYGFLSSQYYFIYLNWGLLSLILLSNLIPALSLLCVRGHDCFVTCTAVVWLSHEVLRIPPCFLAKDMDTMSRITWIRFWTRKTLFIVIHPMQFFHLSHYPTLFFTSSPLSRASIVQKRVIYFQDEGSLTIRLCEKGNVSCPSSALFILDRPSWCHYPLFHLLLISPVF